METVIVLGAVALLAAVGWRVLWTKRNPLGPVEIKPTRPWPTHNQVDTDKVLHEPGSPLVHSEMPTSRLWDVYVDDEKSVLGPSGAKKEEER